MLAKSTVILAIFAVGLSSLSNEKSTVSANTIPDMSRISFDVGDNFDDYYQYMRDFYRSGLRKVIAGGESYQHGNVLQQIKSTNQNHIGTEVFQDGQSYNLNTTGVDHYSGALTLQVGNTWQHTKSSGENYMGSQAYQKDNIYVS